MCVAGSYMIETRHENMDAEEGKARLLDLTASLGR